MVDAPFNYETITSLYNSSGALQNKATYTPYSRDKILRLRDDIDTQGETLSITGGNWTNNNFNWSKGDRFNLDIDKRLWLSYISDLRTACEDLATEAGISAPTWTVATLVPLYKRGKTATISGTTLTQTGADFDDVTDSSDHCYIQSGTSATVGRYLITSSTTDTLTLSGYSGDSGAGDVEFDVMLTSKQGTYTTSNLKSLITDVQIAILDVQDDTGTFRYFVDSVGGDDTTGDGSRPNPYETWNKAVTQCNSVAGNIFFMVGVYAANLAITQANITIQGESTDSVVINVSTWLAAANGFTARNIWFGDGSSLNDLLSGRTGFLFDRCVFQYWNLAFVSTWCMRVFSSSGTFNHCACFGRKEGLPAGASTWGNPTGDIGIGIVGTGTIAINNNLFYTLWGAVGSHSGSTATVTMDDFCAFDNIGAGGNTSGGASFPAFTPFSFASNNIGDTATMYLFDDSDLVSSASDGFDIGAYPQSPYNILRTATESITLIESSEMSLKEPSSDAVNVDDDIASVNMNVSVDMPFWGLFESASDGSVIYLTNALITSSPRADKMVSHLSNFQYNGASLDVSWDNTAGDLFEVHIVSDDGSTDYAPAAWWANNTLFPAASTTDVNGTRGYAVDCYIESELDEEWGDQGAFSTVSSDGVNDQQWDITLKIRIKNTVTGTWSELITLSKAYNFNTFAGCMAYHADNPRVVDNEYADHANYTLNPYHTTDGSDKLLYTRPDGVDFASDNRRYAYTPAFKGLYYTLTQPILGGGNPINDFYTLWQERDTASGSTIGSANAKAIKALYPCIWANYGNWNNNGNHCFATTFNDVYDDGTFNSAVPILGSSTNKLRYLWMQAYLGGDCSGHSSFQSFMYYMPSGELMSHSGFGVGDHLNENSDFEFIFSTVGGCNGNRYYLEELNVTRPFGDRTYWWFTNGEIRVNELTNGKISFNEQKNADDGIF